MPTQVITNVPAAKVALYTQIYLNAGAISVTPVPESDGEVTLIVVYADHGTFDAMMTTGTRTQETLPDSG